MFLLEHGYVMGSVDKTLVTLNHGTDFLLVQIYMDNIIFGGSSHTTNSSALEFGLSCLCTVSDEQYESIPDDEIALLVRKFRALHRFCKERRRSPRGCFECGDTTHFIA
jgi:hypothetical protein